VRKGGKACHRRGNGDPTELPIYLNQKTVMKVETQRGGFGRIEGGARGKAFSGEGEQYMDPSLRLGFFLTGLGADFVSLKKPSGKKKLQGGHNGILQQCREETLTEKYLF